MTVKDGMNTNETIDDGMEFIRELKTEEKVLVKILKQDHHFLTSEQRSSIQEVLSDTQNLLEHIEPDSL